MTTTNTTPTLRQLHKLIAEHEAALAAQQRIVDALRMTLAMLLGEKQDDRAGRAETVLTQALALDAARRNGGNGNGNGNGHHRSTKKGPGYATREAEKARRTRTAHFLASLSHDKPTPIDDPRKVGIGPLMTFGYVKRKGEGYVRTAKEFHVAKPA